MKPNIGEELLSIIEEHESKLTEEIKTRLVIFCHVLHEDDPKKVRELEAVYLNTDRKIRELEHLIKLFQAEVDTFYKDEKNYCPERSDLATFLAREVKTEEQKKLKKANKKRRKQREKERKGDEPLPSYKSGGTINKKHIHIGRIFYADYKTHEKNTSRFFGTIDLPKLMDPDHSMQPVRLDNVYLKESKIHGRGVFAKRDIEKFEVITYYPADLVITNRKVEEPTGGYVSFLSNRYIAKFGCKMDLDGANMNYLDYAFGSDGKTVESIVGCPEFDDNPHLMGQFINDCTSHDSSKESIKNYEDNYFVGLNCIIIFGIQTVIIAERDIKKDEEILTTYGVSYWNGFNERAATKLK